MPDSDRYQILRLLGRGSFGEVYLALYLGRQGFVRQVALKILRPDIPSQDELARRIRDEARMLGLVHHRAIVGVDRLIHLDGRWAVVMEYVEGVSLDELARRAPVACGPALEIAAEVARALHACGLARGLDGQPLHLMHRDIKPSNVLLTAQGDVKVLDFGIARADYAGREAETHSLVFGSPGYMAPERFELRCGPEADIYALGVVLFEMLARRRFGRARTAESRHEALVEENLGSLAELRSDVGPEILALLHHMLAFEPAARPNAVDLSERLSALAPRRDPSLARWSEKAVPPLLVPTPGAEPGGLIGLLLEQALEGAEAPSALREVSVDAVTTPTRFVTVPAPARPRRVRWGEGLVALGLVLGLFCAGVGTGRWGTRSPVASDEGASEPVTPVTPANLSPDTTPAPTQTQATERPATERRATERRATATRQPPTPIPSQTTPPLVSPPEAPSPVAAPQRTAPDLGCPPRTAGKPKMLFVESPETAGLEIAVEGQWTPLPACVTLLPLYGLRRVASGQTTAFGSITVGEDRSWVTLRCDLHRCLPERET